MISEKIAVAINGVVFDEYTSLDITGDIYTIGASLTLQGTNPQLRQIPVGAMVAAQINSESVFAGMVETVAANYSKGATSVTVEATDLLGYLRRVQINRFKTYQNVRFMSIVRDIFARANVAPVLNPVAGSTDVTAIIVDEFSVERGQSVADALSSLCVNNGVICFCDNSGAITIAQPKGAGAMPRHKIAVGDDKVLSAEYRVSSVNSWRVVQAHKQGEKLSAAKTVFGADMYWLDRLPCFCPSADANRTKATAVAKLNECRNAGFSYTINTAGVRCGNGLVWQINEKCIVADAHLTEAQGSQLYINSRNISFSKDRGTVTTIGMGMEPVK